MTTLLRLTAVVLPLTLAGCGGAQRTARENVPPKPVPDSYRAIVETNKGNLTVEVPRAWAPEGAERFYRLLEQRFYADARFFRVVPRFVVQFGIHGNPAVSARWRNMTFADDPPKEHNRRGTISFAANGRNTRTTQVFINLKDNLHLDKTGLVPFGKVVEGMDVADRLYSSYGEFPPRGAGPDPNLIEAKGNAYLESKFPRLDYIIRARIVDAK